MPQRQFLPKNIEFFQLINHACRVCGGRLLSRKNEDGHVTLRCAECGIRAEAKVGAECAHRLLCYCGARLMTGFDARLRCTANTAVTPELSQEVLVMHLPDEPPVPLKPTIKPPRAALLGGFEW